MVLVMLRAFVRACIADIRAQLAHIRAELRAPAHEGRGRPAHVSAIPVEPDAIDHHLNVSFGQASLAAVPAHLSAPGAGIDTRLKFVGHDEPRSEKPTCLTC
jgi:hypothetical protein